MSDSEPSRQTVQVSPELFARVYESPASLPGAQRAVTPDEDVRAIEEFLGMRPGTIRAPLWVSGDDLTCAGCGRQTNWLDIVRSAATTVHSASMITRVILGENKYVNIEAPHEIAGVTCVRCGESIAGLLSFKCHNWAYAFGDLEEQVALVRARFAD